ncbi:MAG: hypothetical protein WA970_16110, partial [Gammaproteobacteria bacterium]
MQIDPAVGVANGDVIRIEDRVYRIKEAKDGLLSLADALERAVTPDTPVQKVTAFESFRLRDLQTHLVYIGHAELLNLEQRATIRLLITPTDVVRRLANLNVRFELYGTRDGEKEPAWHGIDRHSVLGGELLLEKAWPGSVDELEVEGKKSRWLRAKLAGPITSSATAGARVSQLTLRVESNKTQQSSAGEGSQTIKHALHNSTPLPLTTRFYPFGAEPRRFDTFALAAPEALSKKSATVTLDVKLVDASVAGFAVPFSVSDPSRGYAIGVNGRLQVLVLDVEKGEIAPWRELDHPEKLPDRAGQPASGRPSDSADVRLLRLDSGVPPQVVKAGAARRDLIVVQDRGGRFWTTRVYEDGVGTGVFKREAWFNLPGLPEGIRSTDVVLLPWLTHIPEDVVARSPQSHVSGANSMLFAATKDGLYRLALNDAGWPVSRWEALRQTGKETPNFENKVRLVPILPPDWPKASSNNLGIVLVDAEGVLWRARFGTAVVTWTRILSDVVVSTEIRPIAASLGNEHIAVFAATKEERRLFAVIDGNEGVQSYTAPEDFQCQIGTSLLCLPGYRDVGS